MGTDVFEPLSYQSVAEGALGTGVFEPLLLSYQSVAESDLGSSVFEPILSAFASPADPGSRTLWEALERSWAALGRLLQPLGLLELS